jgi:glycosyltransferase involved in cell wall biosynthesis
MRVSIVSMMTFSDRSYRGFLDEVAVRVDSLTVVTADMTHAFAAGAEPGSADAGYELHILPPRLARTPATVVLPGLRRLVADSRPDVVHVVTEPWQLLAAQAVQAAGSARAAVGIQFAENGPRMAGPGGLVRQVAGGCVLRRCDYAAPMTSQSAEIARRMAKAIHVEILPPPSGIRLDGAGGHADGWFGGAPSERFRIAFVGRLVEEKGLRDLMRTCDDLERDVPLAVAVAGSGPLGPVVSRWGAEKGHFVYGPLDHDAALALMRASDLLVVPSRTIPGWTEQFGRVAVEAMTQGTPVLAYDSGALREVVGDAGFVVAEGDTTALASAIRAAALLPERGRAELRERARGRAARFTDAALAEQHVALWRSVCNPR